MRDYIVQNDSNDRYIIMEKDKYKICFITTKASTINAFIMKTALFLSQYSCMDISFICDEDDDFRKTIPPFFHYYPVKMNRGIDLHAIRIITNLVYIFKKEKFDLVQYSTPNASLYSSVASKIANIPTRLYCQWGMIFTKYSGFKRFVFKSIEKTICFLSTEIEPDSFSNLKFAHKEKLYRKEKGRVIWNGSACGVDLRKFDINRKENYKNEIRNNLGIKNSDFVFGYVGRITKDKGINELLASFFNVNKNDKKTHLICVGQFENDGTIDEELMNLAISCDNVHFVGEQNEVEKYFSSMDAYVLPSYREGFGMTVIEAQAMGLPVIITNIPGPKDVVENRKNGLVVNPKKIDELTSAMINIIHNTELLNYCNNYSPIRIKQRFNQDVFFKKVLEDRMRLLKGLK